jgi:hypothetical protein
MLRSLAEMVGGGCFVTNHDGQGREYRGIPDQTYRACNDHSNLCLACRMFGMMGRRRNARVHKGNVSIGDALVREEEVGKETFEVLLESKGARHTSFYTTPETGHFDGLCRKMYFHRPRQTTSVPPLSDETRRNRQEFIQRVEAVLPGHHFDFEVQFSNLEPEELSLLIYILALEDEVDVTLGEERIHLRGPMRHKIGLAKPLGMGSCHIKIEKLVVLAPPAARFASLQHLEQSVYEGNALEQEIRSLTRDLVNDTSPTMQQLRKIMVWDPNDPRSFRYPDHHWFQNQENSLKNLKLF